MAQISQFVKQQPGTSIYNWMSQKAVTDLVQSVRDDIPNDLNGTNYVMVYGVGTPSENAAELQAAYDEAKKMPRYIGSINAISEELATIYKGQTIYDLESGTYGVCNKSIINEPLNTIGITNIEGGNAEEKAKSVRTTVIVAPGIYDFNSEIGVFEINSDSINIVSLTGHSDVIINDINCTAEYVYVKGLNAKNGLFYLTSKGLNQVFENCIGGDESFSGTSHEFKSICINCTVYGTWAFGNDSGVMTGLLYNCKMDGTYAIPSMDGKIYNCIDGNGNLINFPLLNSGPFRYTYETLLSAIDAGKNVVGENFANIIFDSGVENGALIGVDFTGCNFVKNNSESVDFTGCNFTGCNLTMANFYGATLTNANLSFANLSGANLSSATFTNTILTGANVDRASFYECSGLNTDINIALANVAAYIGMRVSWLSEETYVYNGTIWEFQG